MRVPHLPLDLGTGHEGRHGVHDHHVYGAAADQHLGDLESLLAGVRLGHQQVVHVHTQLAGVPHVQRVLGVDEGRDASLPLGIRDDVEAKRRLPAGLGPVDFADAAPRDATDADRGVEVDGARRDHFDLAVEPIVAHSHDGPLAVGPLDLADRGVQGLLLLVVRPLGRLNRRHGFLVALDSAFRRILHDPKIKRKGVLAEPPLEPHLKLLSGTSE